MRKSSIWTKRNKKEQKAEDLTRTEEEVLTCQEEMRKIAAERNALLSKSLQTSIEAGLIALEDGKIQIQASFLFPINGANPLQTSWTSRHVTAAVASRDSTTAS